MGLLVQPRPQAPTQTCGFRRKQWMAQESVAEIAEKMSGFEKK